ncbi:MAG TPA: glycosyltransferase family 4 protein [Polyangiaceae bacterium]|jgi:glycosyltransferase involved in cell wall biosynthesis|nr:glycosyltransferase family 4 protein [Polyangiaceae bacterium]
MSATAAWSSAGAHCFLVPALTGPVTGGTLYNRELTAALASLTELAVIEPGAPRLDAALERASVVWVDSLYLELLPELSRRAPGRTALILHYLPSFVELGRAAARSELNQVERAALDAADAFLVPSAFMRDALEAIVAPTQKKIFVVEPGSLAGIEPAERARSNELNAIVLANVVPGKGIEAWLSALATALLPSDGLRVSIVGSLTADRAHAARCRRLVDDSALLRERIVFSGPRSPSEALCLLAGADVFVSASRMESYGLALREARVAGIPILARAGGNVAAHVSAEAGGELCSDETALARALVALARNPAVLSARQQAARTHTPAPRSWQDAAREFLTQLVACEK